MRPARIRNWRAYTIFVILAIVMVTSSLAISVRDSDDAITTKVQATYDNDVSVDSINSPSGTIPAGDVVVNATVTNRGNLSSGAFQVNLTVMQTGLPELAFNDSFESGSVPPPGWGDYSTGLQVWLTTRTLPHSGIRSLVARQELYGNALLGSPAINVSSEAVLKFWARCTGFGFSYLNITLSTNGHTWADLVTSPVARLSSLNTSSTGGITTVWTQFSCDLSGYAGQPIYIGFLHSQPLLGYDMCLDDVTVENLTGSIAVFNDTVLVSNLDVGNSMFVEFAPSTAAGGNYSIAVNVYMIGDQDPTNDILTANITVEQVPIPEFSTVLVPVVALVAVVFFCRRRLRKTSG